MSVEDQEARYNLRGNRERSYDHRFANKIDNPANSQSYEGVSFVQSEVPYSDFMNDHTNDFKFANYTADLKETLFGFIFTQMSANKGIRKHGDRAKEAMMKEIMALDSKAVFKPFDATNLSEADKRRVLSEALRAVNLIKEKRDGTLKGRTCADGRRQRGQFEKSETASPTVSPEALFLSLMIDAKEGRHVATADVASAYLNADMPDYVLLRIEGDMIDIICDVNPSLRSGIVTDSSGKRVLIVVLNKALYGCVKCAMLWYELFWSVLKGMGFELNPVDHCVANATINGKTCTVCWYVDDNKISHVEVKVVRDVIKKIEDHFGKMKMTEGPAHVFLGMKIDFLEGQNVQIDMSSYLTEAIRDSGLNIQRTAASPARKGLFTVDEDSPELSEAEAERFVSTVYKLAHVGLRGRSDLRPTLGFLMTRVHKPTKQDQCKLKRCLEYIKGTLGQVLVLGADDFATMWVWVDVAFATHPDRKSHTGGAMSFGRGAIMCMSNKHKLNTKSSTEAEFVGASDYLPNVVWAKMFLKGQGYDVKHFYFQQDNESTIKLLKNGRRSAGKQSRHIDIRYWWAKDRIEREGITVQYCPTLNMLADFLSKPLQGTLFRKFRAVLLGSEHISVLLTYLRRPPGERVGEKHEDDGISTPSASQTSASRPWLRALRRIEEET